MQLHFKEKKKRKPLGDLGGRAGNLKLTPKVFFSSFFFKALSLSVSLFFWKAVKCRERSPFLPPASRLCRNFGKKLTAGFLRAAGGMCGVGDRGLWGPGNVFWKRLHKNGIVRNYILIFGGEGWH